MPHPDPPLWRGEGDRAPPSCARLTETARGLADPHVGHGLGLARRRRPPATPWSPSPRQRGGCGWGLQGCLANGPLTRPAPTAVVRRPSDTASSARFGGLMTPQPSGRAAGDTRRAIASARLLRAIADLRWDLLVLKTALRMHRRYDPNQPRVPAGSAEGGQWTSGGGTSPREMSGRRGRPFAEGTPAQQAVMVALRARIDAAAARIKDRDPTWRRPESMISGTVESRIEHLQAVAAAAEAHEALLVRWGLGGPGRFAVESFPAPVGRRFNQAERDLNDLFGNRNGCNTCGVRTPGTVSGHWYFDHQPNTGWNPWGRPQDVWPQCQHCSNTQGAYVRWLRNRGEQ